MRNNFLTGYGEVCTSALERFVVAEHPETANAEAEHDQPSHAATSPNPQTPRVQLPLHQRLELQLLRHEAESLLKGPQTRAKN